MDLENVEIFYGVFDSNGVMLSGPFLTALEAYKDDINQARSDTDTCMVTRLTQEEYHKLETQRLAAS